MALFEKLAHDFDFPDYFGKNWDALTDCLSDLNWLDSVPKRIVLVWRYPLALHDANPDDFYTTLRVLNHVTDRWWSSGVLFYVLLDDPEQAVPLRALPLLLVDRSML